MCEIKDTKKRQQMLFEINPTFDKLNLLYVDYKNDIQSWYEFNKR